MADDSLRRKPVDQKSGAARPDIWAEGRQRPPFDIRALGRAALHLSREGVAPLNAWAARTARRVAVNVKNGAGRIPEEKLGRAARFVPSHLRVAAWIKNLAATFAHASATADQDVKRGNALVAEIEPHLWLTAAAAAPEATPDVLTAEPEPVVLPEPMQLDDDPLASIRDDLEGKTTSTRGGSRGGKAEGPSGPPAPPGPLATTAIQVTGYLIGWATSFIALPYGLMRALWLYGAKYQDLRQIGRED